MIKINVNEEYKDIKNMNLIFPTSDINERIKFDLNLIFDIIEYCDDMENLRKKIQTFPFYTNINRNEDALVILNKLYNNNAITVDLGYKNWIRYNEVKSKLIGFKKNKTINKQKKSLLNIIKNENIVNVGAKNISRQTNKIKSLSIAVSNKLTNNLKLVKNKTKDILLKGKSKVLTINMLDLKNKLVNNTNAVKNKTKDILSKGKSKVPTINVSDAKNKLVNNTNAVKNKTKDILSKGKSKVPTINVEDIKEKLVNNTNTIKNKTKDILLKGKSKIPAINVGDIKAKVTNNTNIVKSRTKKIILNGKNSFKVNNKLNVKEKFAKINKRKIVILGLGTTIGVLGTKFIGAGFASIANNISLSSIGFVYIGELFFNRITNKWPKTKNVLNKVTGKVKKYNFENLSDDLATLSIGVILGTNITGIVNEGKLPNNDQITTEVEKKYEYQFNDNYKIDLEPSQKIEEINNIYIGDSIEGLNTASGNVTAYDAVNGENSISLNSNIVNADNSRISSFAIVNEDGTINSIISAEDANLEDLISAGYDKNNIAVLITDLEKNPQSWINASDLISEYTRQR